MVLGCFRKVDEIHKKMNSEKPNPLPPLVYAVLVFLALAAGVIALGNQAGWWSIGE
jgi:hypothetical protein